MTVQTLLSAMHLEDYTFIDRLNIKTDTVIINQCDKDERQEIDSADDKSGRNVLFISSKDRGLSKSRNLAVSEAVAQVCILCDNDVKYVDNAREIIESAYERLDADVLVFFIERPERKTPVFSSEKDLGYNGAMRIFSPEITFKKEALERAGISFNEDFGAGAKYAMGEENIFLFEAIRKGLAVKYCPTKIASLIEDNESTWFKGYTDKFFIDRGANYYAMTKSWYLFLIFQFAVRKIRLYKSDNSFINAVKQMLIGASEYKRITKSRKK